MGFKVIPKIKNDAEELAKKKEHATDYFSSPQISEDTKVKSDELIAMLEKQVGKKKKKEKMLKKDNRGTLIPANIISGKGLIKGVIVGLSIIVLVLTAVLIFSGKQNLNTEKYFESTIEARIFEEYGGNMNSTYEYKELNISNFQNGAKTKEKYRYLGFNLKRNKGNVYVYSMNFSIKTEGTGIFAIVAVVKDGNNISDFSYWNIISKSDKELQVEIILNHKFDTDNNDCSITIYTQSIHDEFYASQSMDESIGGWTLYNLKFKK